VAARKGPFAEGLHPIAPPGKHITVGLEAQLSFANLYEKISVLQRR
jgi:hypothetical protein